MGKRAAANSRPLGLPPDVAAIRKEIRAFYDTPVKEYHKNLGRIKWGVYAFYDYDGEPIYIGQTFEGFSSRIGRHLTNQRSDAVAMRVLDPFEVAEIRAWPLDLSKLGNEQVRSYLDRAEFTLFQKVIAESQLKAVLNEKPPRGMEPIKLPEPVKRRIIPEHLYPERKHPDVRIARRASTIATLARVISERKVAPGLRRVLVTQARRLERLAAARMKDFAGVPENDESSAAD